MEAISDRSPYKAAGSDTEASGEGYWVGVTSGPGGAASHPEYTVVTSGTAGDG